MAERDSVRLRRTWPQRLLIAFNLFVIGSALYTAWSLDEVTDAATGIPRVQFAPGVLVDDPPPIGAPLTFVLVGADSGEGLDPDDPAAERPDTVHTDVIMLLRVDPSAPHAWLLSIPRDLRVEIPDGGEQKINAAYTLGREELLVETITEEFDVEVNHFVSVDFAGFASVVDQLGGVPVDFAYPTIDERVGLLVPEAGCYRLDGSTALKYVRSRAGFRQDVDGDGEFERVDDRSDFDRIRRQQDFLILALQRAVDRGVVGDFRSFADTIEAAQEAVILDGVINLQQLYDLAQQFGDFSPETLTRLSLDVADDLARNDLVLLETAHNVEVLDVFRGRKAIGVFVYDGSGAGRSTPLIAQLGAAGFDVARQPFGDEPDDTVVRYGPGRRADAVELLRHLDGADAEAVADDGVLELVVGTDEPEVRPVPRDPADVEDDLPPSVDEATPTTSSTPAEAAEVTEDPEGAAPTTRPAPDAPTTTLTPTTTTAVVIGQPPDGADCSRRLTEGG